MKFAAVFVAVLAFAAAAPRQSAWTVHELSEAISDPNTDPALLPHLANALDYLMEQMFSGSPITSIPVVTPAGIVPSPSDAALVPVAPIVEQQQSAWTVHELSEAITNPNTDPALLPHLVDALEYLMEQMYSGSPITSIPVVTPAGIVPSPSDAASVPVAPVVEGQSGWTVHELSEAITNPNTDPALLPHLVEALETLMEQMHSGSPITSIPVVTPAGVVPSPSDAALVPVAPVIVVEGQSGWTVHELSEAITNPNTDPALLPHLVEALETLMEQMHSGSPITSIPVVTPAGVVPSPSDAALVPVAPVIVVEGQSGWTVHELSEAITNPNTDPALLPHLVEALETLMEQMYSGSPITSIPVVTPAGVVPSPSDAAPEPVAPIVPDVIVEEVAPVAPVPVVPVPEAPVAPAPVAEASPAGPLVQLIVNINMASAAANPIIPAAVGESIVPVSPVAVVEQPEFVSPVAVVEQPEFVSPVTVVEQPAIVDPVVVVDQPAIVEPVVVVEPETVSPIIIGEPVLPVLTPENPADVIAVAAPDVNPVDIISPVPAVAGGQDTGILV